MKTLYSLVEITQLWLQSVVISYTDTLPAADKD